jgi:tRNA U38,U39,U40 pseudouridine synthase TruA
MYVVRIYTRVKKNLETVNDIQEIFKEDKRTEFRRNLAEHLLLYDIAIAENPFLMLNMNSDFSACI